MVQRNALAAVTGVLLLCVDLVAGGNPLCIANRCYKKREVFGDVGVAEGNLVARQAADPYSTIYPLTPIPFWAALPYSTCGGVTAGTTVICPLQWYCHCKSGTDRSCLPTSTAGPATITTCSPYSGPTTCTQCEFTWQTTLTQMANAYGQCGGYYGGVISQAWDVQTLCPINYKCNPVNFWYAQCVPATQSQTPLNPMQYWACGSQSYSYATKQGDRCGGHCYKANGKVDGLCPSSMKCWTETVPIPGYDAYCYTSSPTTFVSTSWGTNLCYPIPYDYPGSGGPTCKPQTGATQTPYGQCFGSTANAGGSQVSWNGPTNCPCGYGCSSYNPSYGICQNIPNFPTTACNTVGSGTQTLYGRCGGSTVNSNGSAVTWTSPTLCQAGATCVTDNGGWYAQCTTIAKNRKRSPSPAAGPLPAPLPAANAAPEPTAAATFMEKFDHPFETKAHEWTACEVRHQLFGKTAPEACLYFLIITGTLSSPSPPLFLLLHHQPLSPVPSSHLIILLQAMSDDRTSQQGQQMPEHEIRSINHLRHVQPSPPSNADSDEYRQELALFGRRFHPLRVSDCNVRALELQSELYPDGVTASGAPRPPTNPAPPNITMPGSGMTVSEKPSDASLGAASMIAERGSPRRVSKDPDEQISAARMPRRRPAPAAEPQPHQLEMHRPQTVSQGINQAVFPITGPQSSSEAPPGRNLISPVPADVLLPTSPMNAGETDWVSTIFSPPPPQASGTLLLLHRDFREPFPLPGSSGGRIAPLFEVLQNHAEQQDQTIQSFMTEQPETNATSGRQTPTAPVVERTIQSGQITPPARPTPSPAAPGPSRPTRDRKFVESTQRAGTPGPPRMRLRARGPTAPQTAPPMPSVMHMGVPTSIMQGLHRPPPPRQVVSPSPSAVGGFDSASRIRRVSPTFISPPSRPSLGPAAIQFGMSTMPRPITATPLPNVSQSIISGSHVPHSSTAKPSSLVTPSITGPRTFPPRSASPSLPQMISLEQTPLLGFGFGRTLQDTLRRASELTPTGMSSPGTPMASMLMTGNFSVATSDEYEPVLSSTAEDVRSSPWNTENMSTHLNSRMMNYHQHGAGVSMHIAADAASMSETSGVKQEAVGEDSLKGAGKSNDDMHTEQHCCNCGGRFGNSHNGRIEKHQENRATENLHISYTLQATKASAFPDPAITVTEMQGQKPATYSFRAGQLTLEPPYGSSVRDTVVVTHYANPPTTTIEEVMASAEKIRDVAKRIESVLKGYRSSLKIDVKELKQSNKEVQHERATTADATADELLPSEADQAATKEKLLKTQGRYGEHLDSLFDDLSNMEYDYRRNLERFNRQADDPILDPLAGIPLDAEERTEEEEVTYRGRLFLLAKLEKRGYKGGPVRPFLQLLEADEWKDEMREAILLSDPRILQDLQVLAEENEGGPIPDIDFDGIDLTDLEALPWGHFKLTGQDEEVGALGKENAGPEYDITSPILPSESEDEEELEQSYLSDPGLTPALKNRLQQVKDYDRL
ncbi:hypothetical protein Dda_4220 [Drechslerella dactyloides]|uniref:CBM1 domain-containing protein n=1 Tax=Drechslerella dactyloides TaxID=74499 RepID=A0AAD6NKN6_DREDA|nr:hypothetical protein Dda_4220 [Drechslerella dactyloides]